MVVPYLIATYLSQSHFHDSKLATNLICARLPRQNVALEDGKVTFNRSQEERLPLVHALNRIEGQVQGIRRMLEQDRYCGDELQQIKATISALRAVARTIAIQHLEAGTDVALGSNDRAGVLEDLQKVLRQASSL